MALTALMRVPRERRAEVRAEALGWIIRSGQNDIRRLLLAECVAQYSELDQAEWVPVKRLFVTHKPQGVRPTIPTIADHMRHDGRVEDVLFLLETRFGDLSEVVKKRVEAMSEEQLHQLLGGFARGQSLKELGLED